MGLIDSHAHLTYDGLSERIEEVLAHCARVGVDQVITVGTSVPEIRKALALAERFPGQVFVAGGIHPHESGEVSETDWAQLSELWQRPEVAACGEMGLDYHYDFAERDAQRDVFARQLELARKVAKPIVLHSRDALDDTIGVLLDHDFAQRPAVFHCFTGTAAEGERIAEHGWRISFTGVVTFRNSGALREVARSYPADLLMVETDSPYLSPEPVRGRKPNEPAHVAYVARFLAELRGVSYEEFVERSAQTTRSFFGLPPADQGGG